MEKYQPYESLPQYSPTDQYADRKYIWRARRRSIRLLVLTLLVAAVLYSWKASQGANRHDNAMTLSSDRLRANYAMCSTLRATPNDPGGDRDRNTRLGRDQKPILIRNTTVWTGEPSVSATAEEIRSGEGYSWARFDVLVQNGLIHRVEPSIAAESLPQDYEVMDAGGHQLTTGIVDMHSHTGVASLPGLGGNEDTNELSSDITPFVRSLDGFNPLDPQIKVIKSGGVTTSLILPGSGNNMGGEAYVIKHAVGKPDGRPELSIESLLADPDRHWRYMKMACGENAKNVYGKAGRDFGPFSRLGEAWYFRHAFEEAAKLKNSQDDWCAAADSIGAEHMPSYLPLDLRWESLSAVLRGQVLVNTHCYTIPDLESFIGYTNEFKFSIRAFHHAHSTFLIPEVLNRAYGNHTPAAALFADNMYYKAESYAASEQAGKILHENGITPVYVSDNPVLNAQHVVAEAAKAYKNGLLYHVALAGVTSASAELLGLGKRIGKVKPGYDADLVLWDSDPLSLGATPLQVYIDGVPQFDSPVVLDKPLTPPLGPSSVYQDAAEQPSNENSIVITGVSKILLPGHERSLATSNGAGNIVISDGQILCIGECQSDVAASNKILKLQNGYIAPALTAFGSLLGLEEIAAEADTSDGSLDQSAFSAAIDGLQFEGKNLDAAYRHGVTRAITAPKYGSSGRKGLSVGFRIGAKHALEEGAILHPNVALHYPLGLNAKGGNTPSISSAVAALRTKLLKAIASKQKQEERSPEDEALSQVVNGSLPLVLGVHSADTIASILRLKGEVEAAISATNNTSTKLRLAIFGGAESHILADELAKAEVGVILSPLFSYAVSWDQRRSLTGAPLTNGTAIDVLHAAGVKVAIGVDEDWEARDLFLQAGTVHVNSGGRINETEALALASSNIYDILGLGGEDKTTGHGDLVVFEGNPLSINSQVRAVARGNGFISVYS